ncbi:MULTISPECIES: L,D-transpeptidase family protein [Roseobacteraceae]|jgi:lipoprotein-anchoring transpeptidase ErfK/SrfK|uniref:Putative L,D-transpeptidase YkuD n=1 Tax=Pseudosulfitobacter pseudonitzschiae TaxID=1402135 RepID=A0A221JZD3_9RHOB|nr:MULTISPECIES: L,D-transpeptidase family protein [Roseobacteraceae]ASM71957.1 putative L,D-transpeptidase YkuD [Pseudosulfitobacter pseudonitzschiae]
MSYTSHIARIALLTLVASPLVAQTPTTTQLDPAPTVPPATQEQPVPVPADPIIPMAESALDDTDPSQTRSDVPSVSELSRALSEQENAETQGVITPDGVPQSVPEQPPTDQSPTTQTTEIPSQPVTPATVNAASYAGEGGLPEGRSPVTVKLQVLLDRAGVSVSIIDGVKGGMTESALKAYETRMGLPVDGLLDAQVWDMLGGNNVDIYMKEYTITENDASGLSAPLPSDYGALAQLDRMGFTRVSEKLAERFHMSEGFLKLVNPEAGFYAGETIVVVEPGTNAIGQVTKIIIDKSDRRLRAWDATGQEIANYPVAVGSAGTPSPSGNMTVEAVALEPTYHYNPDVNFKQGENDKPLTLPPGPNGPVGLVWIDLSKPTYGIHGTPEPASLFTAHSHGCVRMANWDAQELASLVGTGVTVEFRE